MSLINREALYEKACDLEAQALSYIAKIANDKTKIEEWKIWSAILIERTGFKHDIFDAPEELPSAQPEQLVTCPIYSGMCGYPSEQCYDCPRHEGAQEKPFWWKEGNAQPDLMPDGTLNISVGVDVAKVGRILLSRTGTQEGGLYYKDAQPEPEELDFVQPHKKIGVKLEVAQPEIVRCKDCRHRDPEDKKCDCGHDIIWQLPRKDEWYCADAERRTDERTD